MQNAAAKKKKIQASPEWIWFTSKLWYLMPTAAIATSMSSEPTMV